MRSGNSGAKTTELAGVVRSTGRGTDTRVRVDLSAACKYTNVDQGIGVSLLQQEMTQPMEGPMAEGIMSTVPEPPMMEAGGNAQ